MTTSIGTRRILEDFSEPNSYLLAAFMSVLVFQSWTKESLNKYEEDGQKHKFAQSLSLLIM